MKLPKRYQDVRVQITKRVFGELASRYWINKNTVLDGWIDIEGNFRQGQDDLTIFPTHFKILGRFYFRKAK